jgi:hypothetical protein
MTPRPLELGGRAALVSLASEWPHSLSLARVGPRLSAYLGPVSRVASLRPGSVSVGRAVDTLAVLKQIGTEELQQSSGFSDRYLPENRCLSSRDDPSAHPRPAT